MRGQPYVRLTMHTFRRLVVPPKLEPPINPALMKHAQKRAEDAQNRVADAITRFAGSTEAIFLSTFVMISQNRADAKQQVIADQEWKTVQEEDQQNRELLDLSNEILALTREVHAAAQRNGHPVQPSPKTPL